MANPHLGGGLVAAAFLLALPVLSEVTPLLPIGLAVLAFILAFPVAWIVRRMFAGRRAQRFV